MTDSNIPEIQAEVRGPAVNKAAFLMEQYRHYATTASFYMIACLGLVSSGLITYATITDDTFLQVNNIAAMGILLALSIITGLVMWRWVRNRSEAVPRLKALRSYIIENKESAEKEIAEAIAGFRKNKIDRLRTLRFLSMLVASMEATFGSIYLYEMSLLSQKEFVVGPLFIYGGMALLGIIISITTSIMLNSKFNNKN